MTENETKSQNAIETLSSHYTGAVKKQPSNSKNIDKVMTEQSTEKHKEYGGREGLNPTRYGDWERNGRCVDF